MDRLGELEECPQQHIFMEASGRVIALTSTWFQVGAKAAAVMADELGDGRVSADGNGGVRSSGRRGVGRWERQADCSFSRECPWVSLLQKKQFEN